MQKGHTEVKASYSHDNIKLESSVTIAAYDPLVVSNKIGLYNEVASSNCIYINQVLPLYLESAYKVKCTDSETVLHSGIAIVSDVPHWSKYILLGRCDKATLFTRTEV